MEILKKKIQEAVNLFKDGNLPKSEKTTLKLIETNPKIPFLYNLLGLILSAQNRIDEAIVTYNKGIKIDPNYAMIFNNLALIYYNKSLKDENFKSNIKKAEELYKKSIQLNPKIPEANTNLGNLYSAVGKNNESIKYHKLAISADPKYFYTYLNIANVYVSIGNFVEAKKYLNDAIIQNPNFSFAHRLLSRITKYSKENPHLLQLKNLYDKTNTNDEINKMHLAFALGKANEDIENFEESFLYYGTANSINRSRINFSLEKEKNYFDEIKKTYNSNLFSKYKNSGSIDSEPIFIVGMPRSGTTLLEQILASHSKVFGADEVLFIPKLINKYFNQNNINLFLQGKFNFEKSNLKKMGEEYIMLMNALSKNSKRTTDKLPANFLNIGLIKLILPKSKIIHCYRNPKDNIFSIFKNHFPGNKINFSSDLSETVDYYNLYFDLMKFWNVLLPDFVLNIKYESLINNTEHEVRRLLNFCDLDWENSCLKFYDTKRPVKSASDTQVRNKIYTSSINLWKKYEKFLYKYYDKLNV